MDQILASAVFQSLSRACVCLSCLNPYGFETDKTTKTDTLSPCLVWKIGQTRPDKTQTDHRSPTGRPLVGR